MCSSDLTSGSRSVFAPGLPTLGETGIDIAIDSWGGVLAPTGTAREVITRLNVEFKKAMGDAEFRSKILDGQTFEQLAPSGGTPEAFGNFLKAEDEKYGRIIKSIGGLATPE